jgi:hypothetical protein
MLLGAGVPLGPAGGELRGLGVLVSVSDITSWEGVFFEFPSRWKITAPSTKDRIKKRVAKNHKRLLLLSGSEGGVGKVASCIFSGSVYYFVVVYKGGRFWCFGLSV